MVRGTRLTKIQTMLRPDHMWPELGQELGKPLKEKKYKMVVLEQPKLKYVRSLRRIYSIDPSDEDYEDIIENARRKLETPMAPAMPCKKNDFQSLQSGNRCFKNSQSQSI